MQGLYLQIPQLHDLQRNRMFQLLRWRADQRRVHPLLIGVLFSQQCVCAVPLSVQDMRECHFLQRVRPWILPGTGLLRECMPQE